MLALSDVYSRTSQHMNAVIKESQELLQQSFTIEEALRRWVQVAFDSSVEWGAGNCEKALLREHVPHGVNMDVPKPV